MGTRKSATEQNRWDDLLLDISRRNEGKTDKLVTDVALVKRDLKANTKETTQLKKEVQETNGSVKQLQADQTKIKEVVFPEKPIKPSELQSVWRDPLIRKVIFVVGGIIILAAIGFNNEDIKGFFDG